MLAFGSMNKPEDVHKRSKSGPLLTEFEECLDVRTYLRPARRGVTKLFELIGVSAKTGINPTRAAGIFGLFGGGALVLSVLGRAHYVLLSFQKQGGGPFTLEVGYLYDLSAGLFFAIVAPVLVGLGFRFIQQSNINLSEASELRLTTADVLTISGANRGLFSSFVLLGLVGGSFGVTFGQEFLPGIGDRYNLPFGYIQADAMAKYEPHKALPESLGQRRAFHLPSHEPFSDPRTIWLSAFPHGPREMRERIFFWIFVFVALTNHSLFATVAFWMLFKVVFILSVYAAGIGNYCDRQPHLFGRVIACLAKPAERIRMVINEFDPGNRFGLSCLVDSLKSIGYLITLCVGTLFLELGKVISGGPIVLDSNSALETAKLVAQTYGWSLLSRIRGPSGAGYFAIAFTVSSVIVLFVIDRTLKRYRKSRLLDQTLTADQRSILRSQDFKLVRQVTRLTGPGFLAAGSLLTLLYKDPGRIVEATIWWEQLVRKVDSLKLI